MEESSEPINSPEKIFQTYEARPDDLFGEQEDEINK